jgi:high-affinity nickel-transport protein
VPVIDPAALLPPVAAVAAGGAGVLVTGLLLGFRHGFDWDHIAAITDITSTSATADVGAAIHEREHEAHPHAHGHGGASEQVTHGPAGRSLGAAVAAPAIAEPADGRPRFADEQRHAMALGTLYALGHAAVVFALGLLALAFGAILPDWVDPIMGRVVGITLLVLGIWVFVSLYQYLRGGTEFRLRSRWMLVFDGARYGWRRFQAKVHGHEHVAPLEMSSYGPGRVQRRHDPRDRGRDRNKAPLIAAVGGWPARPGSDVAAVVGLVVANTVIVVVTATGFVAGQVRQQVYIAIGVLAGVFSIAIGLSFLLGTDSLLPDLQQLLFGAA